MKERELIDLWLNNEISDVQLAELKKSAQYKSYAKIDAYMKSISAPSFNAEEGLQDLKQNYLSQSKVKKLNPYSNLLKIAAILTILIASYVFYTTTTPIAVDTTLAKTEFLLPDTSQVILNSNSTIKYKTWNWESNRNISLEGEAYFKVAKGSTFSINTSQGLVTVVGTQFNVSTKNNEFTVACFEGKVNVTIQDNVYSLTQGKTLNLLNNEIVLGETILANPSWMFNESSFVNKPLSKVFNTLSKEYNVEINSNSIESDTLFTGSFTHNNLQTALESICVPLGLQYTINSNSVIIHEK